MYSIEINKKYKEEKKLSKKPVFKKKTTKKIKSDTTYKTDYLKSRWYSNWDVILCEYINCFKVSCDIHHILSSHRWVRKHSIDGFDLISVCREHHNYIHDLNNIDTRKELLWIVKNILSNKKAWRPVTDELWQRVLFGVW